MPTVGARKRIRSVELREAGATYTEIAEAVGWANRGSAYRAVMQSLGALEIEEAGRLRQVAFARTERMIAGIWGEAAAGDLASAEAMHIIRQLDRDLEGDAMAALEQSVTSANARLGELIAADDTTATVRTGDGSERTVAYADIDRARTQFEWGPAPKPGKGSKPGKAPKKGPAKKQGSAKPATTTSGDDTPTEGHSQP